MPLLTSVRDAAVARLRESLPECPRVEAFAGYLDFEGLSRRGVQFTEVPCLFAAAGGCENQSPVFECEATFWVFAVARNASRPTSASGSALNLIQKAALCLHGQTFGRGGPAIVREIGPVSGLELDKAGFAVWHLRFAMNVAFGED